MIFVNEKSYTELMKKSAMKKKRRKEAYVLELYIDILLSEILMNIEKEQLIKKIDAAIDEGNKQVFMDLSKQYKELSKRYGT